MSIQSDSAQASWSNWAYYKWILGTQTSWAYLAMWNMMRLHITEQAGWLCLKNYLGCQVLEVASEVKWLLSYATVTWRMWWTMRFMDLCRLVCTMVDNWIILRTHPFFTFYLKGSAASVEIPTSCFVKGYVFWTIEDKHKISFWTCEISVIRIFNLILPFLFSHFPLHILIWAISYCEDIYHEVC